MPGPGRELQLRLYRDALSTPWGFRLYGGKDLKSSLAVQKVAVGSPVFGELQRDDILLEIQGCDATQMTHKQAQDIIRNAGGSLLLRVHRSGRIESPAPVVAHGFELPLHKSFMLGRVRDTLTNVIYEHPMTSSGYGSNSLSDYGDVYSPTLSHASGDSGNKYPTWNRPKPSSRPQPVVQAGLMEPGWTPKCLQQPRHRPTSTASQPHRPHEQYPRPVESVRRQFESHDRPAWYGSLRPSAVAKQSDSRVAGVASTKSASPELNYYPSASSWSPAGQPGSAAPGKQLQYNSPLGLYSKENVHEAMTGQLGGATSQETVLAKHESDAYHQFYNTDRRNDHHLHVDHSDETIRQSPSIHILESRFVHDTGVGESDF